ncbi:uncharacterized protein LOC142564168 isoform X1 [Dermacentor variabilis]|uniref:uncharacterized protein LOC142564168 isoform X1 n=1 Tax=Dermacentor variabilis TaxID=34621 RepID=UPI003F5B93F6
MSATSDTVRERRLNNAEAMRRRRAAETDAQRRRRLAAVAETRRRQRAVEADEERRVCLARAAKARAESRKELQHRLAADAEAKRQEEATRREAERAVEAVRMRWDQLLLTVKNRQEQQHRADAALRPRRGSSPPRPNLCMSLQFEHWDPVVAIACNEQRLALQVLLAAGGRPTGLCVSARLLCDNQEGRGTSVSVSQHSVADEQANSWDGVSTATVTSGYGISHSSKVMRQNVADWSTYKSVAAGSTTVMQGDAATQCDQRADVAVQSTWCKEGVSKSTQAELFTQKVSRWAQSNDLEESYSTSPLLEQPQPSKAMPLVLSNSRSDHGVPEEANVDGVIEGDSRFSAGTGAARCEERASSLTVNAGSPFVAYSCRLCSLKFSELDALASHVKTCPWPEPFQCSLCSQTCSDWSATRRHLASHINRAAPECPFCDQTLECRSWTIMRHMQRHHVHVKAFRCNFCWGTFVMKQDILTHTHRCRARVIELGKCLSSTKKCNSQAHVYPHLYKCSICLVTFADVSAVASHMQVHVNEMQHSQADRVVEERPSDCRGQQSLATGSTRVLQGDASAQCDFRTDIAVKSMLAEGISKATEADLCTPKASKWTQSEDLKVCNDASSLLELPLPNEGMPLVLGNSRRTSSGMQEDSELDCVAEGDCVLKVTTDPPCSEKGQGSATVSAGSVVIAHACGLCSRKFQGLDSLTCHVLTCLWPEPFQCSLCSQRCVNWSVTRDHLLTSHVNRATAKCQFCKQPLNLRKDCIVTHMLRLHVGVKLFMCNLCKATFYGRHSLLLHLRRRHECGITHECDWCASSFADKHDLQAHILQHLSAWPYKCHICLATFVEKSDIARHMRDHKNGRR